MMSQNQIFNDRFPHPKELVNYAVQQLPLEHTTKKPDWKCLYYLVESYCSTLQGGNFWIEDTRDAKFPLEDFQNSLKMFFAQKHLWKSFNIKYLKHEHLRVLFFIAALRYRKMKQPQQQIKFQDENESQGGIFDLFLYDRTGENPSISLQIRLLTLAELDVNNSILDDSHRGREIRDKRINTFETYKKDSEDNLRAYLDKISRFSTSEAKTQAFAVLVTPSTVVWLDCGLYYESLTSQLINQPFPTQISQVDPIFPEPERLNQNSQSQEDFYQNQQQQQNEVDHESHHSSHSRQSSTLFLRPKKKTNLHDSVIVESDFKYSEIPERSVSSYANREISGKNERTEKSWHTDWDKHNPPPLKTFPSMMTNPNFGDLASNQSESRPCFILCFTDQNQMRTWFNDYSNNQEIGENQRSAGVRRNKANGFKTRSAN